MYTPYDVNLAVGGVMPLRVSSATHAAVADARQENVQLTGSRLGVSLAVIMSYECTDVADEKVAVRSAVRGEPLAEQ